MNVLKTINELGEEIYGRWWPIVRLLLIVLLLAMFNLCWNICAVIQRGASRNHIPVECSI